ncbi:MAG: phage scaffolding protein [Prevotella sp.]
MRKNLTPELFEQVTDQLGDDFDYDLVPRSRLNKVIKQRNDLRNQLAGVPQPQGTKSKGKSEDDDDDDPTEGVNIEELKKQLQTQSDEAVRNVKIQYAALEKLRAANVIDPELVWSSSAIDKSKLSLDANDQLVGIDDIITQLQKDKAHLFKAKESDVPPGTGKEGGHEFEGVTSKEEFLKLPADKQVAFKQANPEIFKTFMSAN